MQKEMQNKITRLLYELNALDKGTICLEDMAAEIGVSVRTMQRDMKDIQEAEFPLYCPEPGQYAFMEGFSLEKMQLSDKEASMLVFMNEVAASLGSNFDASFRALKKRMINAGAESPFFVKINAGEDYPDTPLVRELTTCVKTKEKATVCYEGGNRACYPVRPLKILWVEGFWYLLALTSDDKLLKFRLEKITSVTPMGQFFTYDSNIENIIRQGTNIWFGRERDLNVLLEVSAQGAKYFHHKNYFPMQKIEKEYADGRLLISCKATCEEEIFHTILHWLPELKIKEPKSLADNVIQALKNWLKENE